LEAISLTGLDEARRTVNKGQSVFLDAASDVSVSDDFGGVKNLSINVRSSGENYAFDQGRVELTRTSRVSFSVATMGNDGVIAVDGVEIGTYEQMSEESLRFAFNRNVSNDAVAQVIRAIKYTNDRNYGSAATIEVSVKARDTGSRESSRTMTFDVPAASIDPGYPSRPSTGFNIFGTSAKDTIVGTIGNDTLAGGLGNDTLAGGYGNDTFVFDSKLGSKNIDRITDFSVPNDTIELSRSIFKKAGKVGLLNKSAFYVGAKAHDKDDRIVYKKTTGALYYDPDGSGSAKAVQFAILQKKLALKHTDFMIV
jgi:Ca2+-binding RTX toxin-like protein